MIPDTCIMEQIRQKDEIMDNDDEPKYAEYDLAAEMADALRELLSAAEPYSGPRFDGPKQAALSVLKEWEAAQ